METNLVTVSPEENITVCGVKPFLKWAGGKTQMLPVISKMIPQGFINGPCVTYVEPFVGSGAVLFRLLRDYPNLTKAIINDANQDLMDAYLIVKTRPNELICRLADLETQFKSLESEEAKSKLFYQMRSLFNARQNSKLDQSAILIFLNKTCFNGLYRVNSKNQFNVPFGRYKNPNICDKENLLAVSNMLQRVEILNGDFEDTLSRVALSRVALSRVESPTFFYFDPPYRPISKTASFNAYSQTQFGDEQQIRLKKFCDKLNTMGIKWLLSNSDPKNCDQADNFFDDLYAEYSISRIDAIRMINSKAEKRGEVSELLISNYDLR